MYFIFVSVDNMLFPVFSSFIVFAFEQKCPSKGQKLKLDNLKV